MSAGRFDYQPIVSGSADASTTVGGETTTYTSDYLSFAGATDKDFALSLSSISRGGIGFVQNQALRPFATTTTGSFSTEPLPALPAIPEPAMWALLIAGFGLVGSGQRRARVVAA